MNYDDPKQTECINEENNFEISNIIDIITSKIKKIRKKFFHHRKFT